MGTLMRVLIVKMSSMGDIIHTLPALTDAGRAIPSIRFDWVVEENFAEIPHWHPLVDKVIPVAIRRWRKKWMSSQTRQEWRQFRKTLCTTSYDVVIDAQGLIKSAWIARIAKGPCCGPNLRSAREFLAALFYQRRYPAVWAPHAIMRVRSLLSQALCYPLPQSVAEYGVDRRRFLDGKPLPPYLVFLHGTTWTTKHWPEEYWIQLAKLANANGFIVKLPWGNAAEQARAERIAANCQSAEILPRLNLRGVAEVIAGAKAIVAVDTGLGHLAAALDVPTVSLYGPTNPILTGALGKSQVHLTAKFPCAPCLSRACTYYQNPSDHLKPPSSLYEYDLKPPCFAALTPRDVWASLAMLF